MGTTTHDDGASEFERAQEALRTIRDVRPNLSVSQMETLALLLDDDAFRIIMQSRREADRGEFESLDDAVRE